MKRSNRFEVSVFAEKVESLLISLQIPYQNPTTYCLAFYHRSALNEFALDESNERVEYLGDAVLELIVTDYLYHLYPEAQEGKLTDIRSALVRGRNLADIALHIGLSEFVMLSRGETQAGGATNPYILANAFEALLGCTYLDILAGSLHVDPKSHLQEIIQARDMVTPTYELLSEA
jgi:ribonuclease-3